MLSTGAGSQLQFSDDTFFYTFALGAFDQRTGATGADSTGGDFLLSIADGGSVIGESAFIIDTSALAAAGELGAGTGTSGAIAISLADAASSFTLNGHYNEGNSRKGSLWINSQAYEPFISNPVLLPGTGGDTITGDVLLDFQGGTLNFASGISIDLESGTANPNFVVPSGGTTSVGFLLDDADAVGGDLTINFANGVYSLGAIEVDMHNFAQGTGFVTPGAFTMNVDNADLTLIGSALNTTGRLNLSQFWIGSTLLRAGTPDAQPDVGTVNIVNGSTFTATDGLSGGLRLYSESYHGGDDDNQVLSGSLSVNIDDATADLDEIEIFNIAVGQYNFTSDGFEVSAADIYAGDVNLGITNGANVTATRIDLGMDAEGTAGATDGGNVFAGDVNFLLSDASLVGDRFDIFYYTNAYGGRAAGSTSGDTFGGDINLTVIGSSVLDFVTFDASYNAENYSITSPPAAAGSVIEGNVSLLFSGGTVGIDSLVFTGSSGVYDTGGTASPGGNIDGGAFLLRIDGAAADLGDVQIYKEVFAGGGSSDMGGSVGGTGGLATGGALTVDLVSGSLAASDLYLVSVGVGLAGEDATGGAAGDGASAIGGNITLNASEIASLSSIYAETTGTGGQGGTGDFGGNAGLGTAGSIDLNLGGSFASLTTIEAFAPGFGGTGGSGTVAAGSGGLGRGGKASLNLSGGSAALTAIALLTLDTDGQGGDGGDATGPGVGGIGGAGIGGVAEITTNGAETAFLFDPDAMVVSANGRGGQGGAGEEAVPVPVHAILQARVTGRIGTGEVVELE